MNAKAIGGGVLIALGMGGFFLYDEHQKKKERDRRGAEAQATAKQVEAKQEEAARPPAEWRPVPDLTGKTEAEAEAALRAAGFTGATLEIMPDRFLCEYDDDAKMVAQGQICNQDPQAGARRLETRAPIKVVIERDTFEAGGAGTTSEWRRMPQVVGLPVEAAQALLAEKGFGPDEFIVEDGHTCAAGTVCETRPEAGKRKQLVFKGRLGVNLK
ncbi:MAG: PASTA domain-containing protein [Kofleriaceae bacterium]|nr:PASTA domain-containing protein [Kofleriaceae bacterium]MCL4223017.1 PASTA domain-containing protein [Myxococcales bacterium]